MLLPGFESERIATSKVTIIWRRRAPRVTGQALDCGHFLAEERPEEVTRALTGFLARTSVGGQVMSKPLVPGRRKV
jgi:pimeloyl-ACP methyl ester carboxylesterase